MRTKNWVLFLLSLLIYSSCANHDSFTITDFDPISNYYHETDTINISLNLENAIESGLKLPSDSSQESCFIIKFKIRNTSKKDKRYYYKVYYQNETYKYNEYIKTFNNLLYNPKSAENFYGSWQNEIGFHVTPELRANGESFEVVDSFQIVGNPRNEKKYFGIQDKQIPVSLKELQKNISRIESDSQWLNEIKIKAKKNKRSLSEQLRIDALWSINYDRSRTRINQRWKRNPRVGIYSFLLVVVEEDKFHEIPESIKNIEAIDTSLGVFINPYYYSLHSPASKSGVFLTQKSKKHLKTSIALLPNSGVYNTGTANGDISNEIILYDHSYAHAHFEQFYHHKDTSVIFFNVPIAHDVVAENYSKELYSSMAQKYKSMLKRDFFRISDKPGSTVSFDSITNAIVIKNPGYISTSELRKENVGITSRIGLTYGKVTARIEFPELINESGVWNGLTCAFWLLSQEKSEWNNRSVCVKGYNPKQFTGITDSIQEQTSYSEIDIEIVNTEVYWPKTSYPEKWNKIFQEKSDSTVIVSCTNWDMACKDPIDYNIGIKKINYHNKPFVLHRWDDWYKALTIKTELQQSKCLGNVFYYQIEWSPEEIIWRLGKNKNSLETIGYMNCKDSKIPDNQMVAIISQEFHHDDWWPTAPFKQSNIPYPKNDLVGYVYEVKWE